MGARPDSAGHGDTQRANAPLAAIASHAAPYLAWLAPMIAVELGWNMPREAAAPVYATKALFCAIALFVLNPLRYYRASGNRFDGCAFGALAGLFVAFMWVFPETPWFYARATDFAETYHRWLIFPLGGLPSYFSPGIFPSLPAGHLSLSFSPAECGWPLTIAKLCGSAFVISAAEEFFFRGFLYRWLRNGDFTSVPLGRYDAKAFWIVALLFGLEHDRFAAGVLAGAVYGYTAIRSGRILPAIVAHSVTNLALGLYVIMTGQYGFW